MSLSFLSQTLFPNYGRVNKNNFTSTEKEELQIYMNVYKRLIWPECFLLSLSLSFCFYDHFQTFHFKHLHIPCLYSAPQFNFAAALLSLTSAKVAFHIQRVTREP